MHLAKQSVLCCPVKGPGSHSAQCWARFRVQLGKMGGAKFESVRTLKQQFYFEASVYGKGLSCPLEALSSAPGIPKISCPVISVTTLYNKKQVGNQGFFTSRVYMVIQMLIAVWKRLFPFSVWAKKTGWSKNRLG